MHACMRAYMSCSPITLPDPHPPQALSRLLETGPHTCACALTCLVLLSPFPTPTPPPGTFQALRDWSPHMCMRAYVSCSPITLPGPHPPPPQVLSRLSETGPHTCACALTCLVLLSPFPAPTPPPSRHFPGSQRVGTANIRKETAKKDCDWISMTKFSCARVDRQIDYLLKK